MKQFSTKMFVGALATAALAGGAQAAVVVSDGGSAIPTGFATGHVNTAAPDATPLNSRFGWDAGEEWGQSFTLGSAITLDSIYFAYNGFDDPGATATITITVDAGDDGSDEITETATLSSADFSGNSATDGNSGATYWMQWDLSSSALDLAAGSHSFSFVMDSSTNEASWLLAPQNQLSGDGYAGGSVTGILAQGAGTGRDAGFAVSGSPVPEPGSLALLGLGGLALLRRRRA